VRHALAVSATLAALTLVACDSTEPALFDEAEVTADVAASAGEAIAASVADMIANQGAAALPLVRSTDAGTAHAVSVNRTRTCFDESDAVVDNCAPIASVRRIVTNFTASGDRTMERTTRSGSTATFTGVFDREASDTLRRIFMSGAETSRSHSGYGTGGATTTVEDGDFTRVVVEAARDTVKTIVFNLPRSSNPWPVSGSIVRVSNVEVTVTRGDRTESRELSRKVVVTFPADAQGNVALTINGKSCNLNLVTRRVTSCDD
jgi:hypothetical protein